MSGRDDDDVIDLVLGKLEGVQKRGGYFMARCPAHDDGKASLSIARGTEQPVVLKCQAGCETADVVAIGLGMEDISAPRDERQAAAEWTPCGPAVAVYGYTDEKGVVLFEVCRTATKQFPQRSPDPASRSGWKWSTAGVARVPYHLPQLAAGVREGKRVFVVEGEKDVHAIEAAGEVATCNPGGAGKWRSEYDAHFRGADVTIVRDKDEPGRKHAEDVARHLGRVAQSVVIVEAAKGKDAADHLAAGGQLGDFLAAGQSPTASAAAGPAPEPVILPPVPRYPIKSLVGPLRAFVDWAVRDGLHPEMAGAAGLAALVTLTGPATLKLSEVKVIRAILWIALVGIASSGKSPALEHAFARIREDYAARFEQYESELEAWETRKGTDGETAGPKPDKPQPLEYDDTTVEAVARWLLARKERESDPSGAVIDDELAATLEGLNQYKGGQGADRSKWLKLWTGADLSIQRVGRGGAQNEVHIYVRHPVVSLAGPLTENNVHLLGKQGSGFRPRFLPHLAPPEEPAWNNAGAHPAAWTECIDALLANREPRTWSLTGPAQDAWARARIRWRRQQNEAEPDDVIEALRKADAQCYRIALVIAESLHPGRGGDIPLDAMTCAVAIMDYVIGCWRALPGAETMASSRAEDVMDAMSARFLAWLESRPKGTEGLPPGSKSRPRATRRQVQQWSHLKATKVSALIMEHSERYPGCVVSVGARSAEGRGKSGGLPTVYVYAPERAAFGVAATPKDVMNPSAADDKYAGQRRPGSVLQSATPNRRNTETATPNGHRAAIGETCPEGSIGLSASRQAGAA